MEVVVALLASRRRRGLRGIYEVLHLQEKSTSRDELSRQVQTAVHGTLRTREDAPSFVFLLGAPGDEEAVLAGINHAVGPDVPVLGGSSADNSVSGDWRQLSQDAVGGSRVTSSGIVICVAWCSGMVSTSLVSGFQATKHRGTVTRVAESDHGRTILEIDGKPARKVYARWTDNRIERSAKFEGDSANILPHSCFCPLGEIGQGDMLRVLHPASLLKGSGGVTSFASAYVGMQVGTLTASPETMARQIAESVRLHLADDAAMTMKASARKSTPSMQALPSNAKATRQVHAGASAGSTFDVQDVVGVLMIFCGGLVMALDDEMSLAAETVSQVAGRTNTMGICCFGEQGMIAPGKVAHGNLMCGCLIISKLKQGKAKEVHGHSE